MGLGIGDHYYDKTDKDRLSMSRSFKPCKNCMCSKTTHNNKGKHFNTQCWGCGCKKYVEGW